MMIKLLKKAIPLILLILCICVISSCVKHQHQYSAGWSSDNEKHWRNAICEHSSETIDLQSHQWDDGVIEYYLHDDTEAVVRFTCYVCGKTKYETIPYDNHDHNYELIEIKDPNCTEFGYSTYKCIFCDTSYISDIVGALGHDLSDEVIEKNATCTESGISSQSCERCHESYTRDIRATGHTYVPIESDGDYTTYECQNCFDIQVLAYGQSIETEIGSEELFDVDNQFAFDIVTDGNEEYIKNHLYIIDDYLVNSEYETNSNYHEQFTVESNGNGVWTIKPVTAYEYDTVYTVKLSGNLKFSEYNGKKLTFATQNDEDHENAIVYKDDIIFLHKLENENPGYYPYNLVADENSDYLYLTVRKTEGLVIGKVLCIGSAMSSDDLDADNQCYFGKIENYYTLSSGEYIVVLSQPELNEVFSKFDISSTQDIIFDENSVDMAKVEQEIICSLYNSDDFIKFLSVVNASAINYLTDKNLSVTLLSDAKTFMDYVQLKPHISFNGSTLIANIKGTIDIPLTDANKNQVGSFKVDMFIELNSTFAVDVTYQLKYWLFVPTGIEAFDISLLQTDTINFDFSVDIDLEYSKEEYQYVQNTDPKSFKIHRLGCAHLINVTDTSKWMPLSVMEVEKKLANSPHLACQHCQPLLGLQSELLMINTKENTIHVYGCYHTTQMKEENKLISDEDASYWMSLGLGYTCCDWCHPDAREEFEYSAYYEELFYCSDWQKIATDISQWAKDSGFDKHNDIGVSLIKTEIVIYWPISFRLEVRGIFSFKLEASLDYEYSYQQSNRYGIRIQGGSPYAYHTKTSSVLSNELTIVGSAEIKVGLLVDAGVTINGLSQWIRAGITAESGFYANLSGVLHWEYTNDEYYAAAYFEAGIYIDVNAYYKLFGTDGKAPIYSQEFPLLILGYDKAYFGYENYIENLQINNSYNIADNDLLKVKYFDLKSMDTKTDELLFGENVNYRVIITFKNGQYCTIENGNIIPTEDAPCYFEDQITISVESKSTWGPYMKGSAAYYLKDYVIDIVVYADTTHNYVTVESNDPSCELDGNIIKFCTVCELTNEEIVKALGHDLMMYPAKSPTCTEEGWNHYKSCVRDDCDYTTCTIIPALGHDYVGSTCTRCANIRLDQGVSYSLSPDHTYYTVSSIGACIDTNITILAEYEGLPVKAIDAYAFAGCTNITSIKIPDSIISIGTNAFMECDNLIYNEYDNAYYLGNDYNPCLALMKAKSQDITSCTINKNTRFIYDHAFENCTSLTEIVMPENVTRIGPYAFRGCTGLESAVMQDGITYIGSSAFENCTSLVTVLIPDTVTRMDSYVFSNCTNLTIRCEATSRPEGWGTYWNYSKLPVIWGYGVASQGLTYTRNSDGKSYTVSSIGKCTDVEIFIPSVYSGLPVTAIGKDAFYRCKNIISVSIPDSVTSIGEGAFCACESLVNVTIPNSITTIGATAFYSCYKLAHVEYDNGYYIGNDENPYMVLLTVKSTDITSFNIHPDTKFLYYDAFGECEMLTSIEIPEGVIEIGSHAFNYCTNLTDITIASTVTNIRDFAFRNCTSLTTITIPEGVTIIDVAAFYGCTSLVNIYVSDGNEAYESVDGNLYTKGGKALIQYATGKTDTFFIVPNTVISINSYAFMSDNLTYVAISNSVTSIEKYAFYECANLLRVIIPLSVTEMSENAFYECNRITPYCEADSKPESWHSKWNSNSSYAIWNCSKGSEGLSYSLSADGRCYSVRGIGSCTDENVVIPASYNGLLVMSIDSSAFSYCRSIITLELPSTIESIGRDAFYYCSNMTKVNLSNITSIKACTFYGCSSLTYIGIPYYVTEIGTHAFYDCTSLESIYMFENVKSIGYEAFSGCSSLTSITIPNGVTNIDANAFSRCYSLVSVKLGSSVTQINAGAFSGCFKLVEIINLSSLDLTIGSTDNGYIAYYAKEIHSEKTKIVTYNNYLFYTYDNVNYLLGYVGTNTSIGLPADYNRQSYEIYPYAFYNRETIVSVSIPYGIKSISNYAFAYCDSLTSITLRGSITDIGDSAFKYCTRLEEIYLPDSVVSIGESAFERCTGLYRIYIPISVTEIGANAFKDCKALIINCRASSRPAGWDSEWNPSGCYVNWNS